MPSYFVGNFKHSHLRIGDSIVTTEGKILTGPDKAVCLNSGLAIFPENNEQPYTTVKIADALDVVTETLLTDEDLVAILSNHPKRTILMKRIRYNLERNS